MVVTASPVAPPSAQQGEKIIDELLKKHRISASFQDTYAELSKSLRQLPPPLQRELSRQLAARNLTFEQYLLRLASGAAEQKQVAVLRLLEKIRPESIRVSSKEIEEFYRMHQAEFLLPEAKNYQAIRILKNVPDARRKIEAARTSLLQGIPMKQLAPPFAPPRELIEAAGTLNPGDFSKVLDSENAYYIIQYVSRQEAFYMPLAELSNYIAMQLRTQKTKRAIAVLLFEEAQKSRSL